MTDREIILKELRRRRRIGVTPYHIIDRFGITKLASRVSELISEGHRIEKGWQEVETKRGKVTRVRVYRLA